VSNGRMSFKYNDTYNKIIRLNGNMETKKIDIDSVEISIFHKGEHYRLLDYIVKKGFIPKTNFFETIAKFPFGEVKTTYIPSMLDKKSFYIINEYNTKNNEVLDFIYLFNMGKENGIIKYAKNKDYYKYNNSIYIKNLKNPMDGYLVPRNSLEEIKLKKLSDKTVKYMDQRIIMTSKLRVGDGEKSDILQIKYGEIPNYLAFQSSKEIFEREKEYWNNWLRPLPKNLNGDTKKIVERFLIYLKTSIDEYDSYTNIGLLEKTKVKDTLYAAYMFLEYGYLEDTKKILTGIVEKEEEYAYFSKEKVTVGEVQRMYIYLSYMKESKDIEFYKKNIHGIQLKINRLVKRIEEDIKKQNILERGYEFKIYYYTYNFLILYRNITGDKKYIQIERQLNNYILTNFIVKDGVKKYILDKKMTYSTWEYMAFYKKKEKKKIMENLYKKTIFRRYPYFSKDLEIDVDKNLSILSGMYINKIYRYGDMNLRQLNKDIIENQMKLPSKINLIGGKKYWERGIDIYLISRYLDVIYDRSKL
jgi:hypothetical protein